MIITAVTRAHHVSLSWARLIQSVTPSQFLETNCNIFFLSTPGSSKWPVFFNFPYQNFLGTSSLPQTFQKTGVTLLDLITRIIFMRSFLLCSLPHSPVTKHLSYTYIFENELFPTTAVQQRQKSQCNTASRVLWGGGGLINMFVIFCTFVVGAIRFLVGSLHPLASLWLHAYIRQKNSVLNKRGLITV
jgi:hypothetical protein